MLCLIVIFLCKCAEKLQLVRHWKKGTTFFHLHQQQSIKYKLIYCTTSMSLLVFHCTSFETMILLPGFKLVHISQLKRRNWFITAFVVNNASVSTVHSAGQKTLNPGIAVRCRLVWTAGTCIWWFRIFCVGFKLWFMFVFLFVCKLFIIMFRQIINPSKSFPEHLTLLTMLSQPRQMKTMEGAAPGTTQATWRWKKELVC